MTNQLEELEAAQGAGDHGVLVGAVGRVTALMAGAAIVVLMFISVTDVVLREVSNRPLRGMLEYTEVWMPAIVFVSMMGAEVLGAHARTPLFVDMLPRRTGEVARSAGNLLAGAFIAWIAYLAWGEFLDAKAGGEVHMGLARVTLWPSKLFVAVGLGLFALALLEASARRLRNATSPDPETIVTLEASESSELPSVEARGR